MLLTYIIIGGLLAAAVITISIYYLSRDSLRTAVLDNIPEADEATIENIIRTGDSVTSPVTVRLSVRNKYGSHLKDMEINATKSDYFYKNQRIKTH